MTTTITEGEIRLIYIELVLIAIIGVFLFLYIGDPIQETSIPGTASVENTTVDAKEVSWLTGMVSPNLGLPIGVTEIIIVSSIFLVPLTILNAFVAIRIIKDLATGWV